MDFGIHGGPGTVPHRYQGTTEFWGHQNSYTDLHLCMGQCSEPHVVKGSAVLVKCWVSNFLHSSFYCCCIFLKTSIEFYYQRIYILFHENTTSL